MLKRKRSFLAGGLTSSCRIKAEALARAFNSRIWPCTWRSVRDVRQDEDEEFYEASSADEGLGGRDLSDPCLTITSEQGRAKFCELLHAVDDATDVFYDVSENAGLSEGGKVSEHPGDNPIHEVQVHGSGEILNCAGACEKSLSVCLNYNECCEASKGINGCNISSTENSCHSSNDINVCDKSSIECLKFDNSCENSNVINSFTRSETECANVDDSCETFNSINMHEQSSTECLHLRDDSDKITNSESSKDVNYTNEFEKLTSLGECMDNQFEDKNYDLVTYSKNINGADNSINLDSSTSTSSSECLTFQNFSGCPSVTNSGTAIDKIGVFEEPIDVSSLIECFKSSECVDELIKFNSGEISNIESSVVKRDNFSNSYECLNDEIDDFLSPATKKSSVNEADELRNLNNYSEFVTSDMQADFSGDSAAEKLCSCINTADTLSNHIDTSENWKNTSSEHLEFTNLPTILNKYSTPTRMDFIDHDICSPSNEELLTVIIDSNSFEILQTPHNNLEMTTSYTNQCLTEQSHTPAPPDFSNSNNDQEATDPLKKSDCPISKQALNETSDSTVDNDCVTNELNFLELSNNDQSQILRLSECLNCNNEQEAISSSDVLIEVTKDGNSPIHKDDCSQFNELECLENKIAEDDYRLKVFEERRPMISRSTSLKTGKTPPGTPSRKKIVRFADVLGLDLEDVRHIISGDLPNIPSSAYYDLILAKDTASPTVSQSIVVDLSSRQQASWESMPGTVGPNALYPLFAIPGQQPDFMERLRSGGVCLESVVIEDCSVQCTCRVMNWGYNKKVLARYTSNGWSSSSDINASYVSDSTRDGTDSFAFIIFLNRERSDLQFAIRYEINGNEYWDNNGGKNYCFSYHGSNASQTSVPCSPTWMEQFW